MSNVETNKTKAVDLTKRLSKQIAVLDYEAMPEEVRFRGRQILIDGIAVGIAGCKIEDPPRVLAENSKELGGAPQASVLGQGFKTSVTQAAMINGGAIHVMDFEPMYNPPNHLTSCTLPGAMAVAEKDGLSGKVLLTGLIKGLEMGAAIRNASNMHDLNEGRFHYPGSVGALASVVSASHVLGLDENQINHAIGIVSSRAGSLWINIGTYTKCLHCGMSASSGLDSALLAKRRFTANTGALEGPKGFIESFMNWEKFDADILLEYGKRFFVQNPGYEIKVYPSNWGTHSGINAALELREKIKDIGNIVKIREDGWNQQYCNRPFPESGLSGKFSHQYTIVRALVDGKIDVNSFEDEKVFDPIVQDLLGKFEICMHDDWPVRLTDYDDLKLQITLKDGTVLETKSHAPKGGHPFGSKPVAFEDHYIKLKACLTKAMSDLDADKVIDMGYHIDSLTAEEMTEFYRLIRCDS